MSYNQQQPKQSPCKMGCGKFIHFNKAHFAATGAWTPQEYLQTAQGFIEVLHNCPMRQQQAPVQPVPGAVLPAAGGVIPQVPQVMAPQAIATGPSITQLMLEELKGIRAVLERLEKRTTPAAEVTVQTPTQEPTPDDFQPAEEQPPA